MINYVSKAPVAAVKNIQDSIAKVGPGKGNTVIIDFCTGNDECVLTTIQSAIAGRDDTTDRGDDLDKGGMCQGLIYSVHVHMQ